MLNDALRQVCVIGAAGKMGSGIALLLLQEMARLEAELTSSIGTSGNKLWLIDMNQDGLDALKPYLREQLRRYAERNINLLRRYFATNFDLVSNEDIINYFVCNAMDIAHFDTDVMKVRLAYLIFEAILEDIPTKVKLFQMLKEITPKERIFLTNTSSIPIHILNSKANLGNRIVGFHFYNPPAVQKLVELILPDKVDTGLKNMSEELAKRLNKTVVRSKDVAGFIGNGHFIREILFACEKVHELSRTYSLYESIYMINKITQDFMIRPMGIFQLLDYVGIDVCLNIFSIMSAYLPSELFQEGLIDSMIEVGLFGGQYPDGSQKNGFFEYEGSKRIGVYSPMDKGYISLSEGKWAAACDKYLGSYPDGHASWKHMQRERNKEIKIKDYFTHLFHTDTPGTDLAIEFLVQSRTIARNLVTSGVAEKMDDVTKVLKEGFFHLYGPDEAWLPAEIGQRR